MLSFSSHFILHSRNTTNSLVRTNISAAVCSSFMLLCVPSKTAVWVGDRGVIRLTKQHQGLGDHHPYKVTKPSFLPSLLPTFPPSFIPEAILTCP